MGERRIQRGKDGAAIVAYDQQGRLRYVYDNGEFAHDCGVEERAPYELLRGKVEEIASKIPLNPEFLEADSVEAAQM